MTYSVPPSFSEMVLQRRFLDISISFPGFGILAAPHVSSRFHSMVSATCAIGFALVLEFALLSICCFLRHFFFFSDAIPVRFPSPLPSIPC